MRRISGAAGIVTLAVMAAIACSDDKPVAPTTGLGIPDRGVANLELAIDDIRGRVIPALGHNVLIDDLSRALDTLTSALDERDTTALRRAINQADDALAALARHPRSGRIDEADIDVVWLVLANARSMTTER